MHYANHPKIGHYSACESGCANRDLPTLRGIVSKFKLCEQRVDEWQRTRRVWRARGAGGDDLIRYTKHLPPPTSEAPWPSLAIALMMYLISAGTCHRFTGHLGRASRKCAVRHGKQPQDENFAGRRSGMRMRRFAMEAPASLVEAWVRKGQIAATQREYLVAGGI